MKQYHGTYACFFLFHVSDDRALCKPGCASLVVIHWYSWRFWWWLVMFVFIDLKWPRVFRCSTPSCLDMYSDWGCLENCGISKMAAILGSQWNFYPEVALESEDINNQNSHGQALCSALMIGFLAYILTKLRRFKILTHFETWWCHQLSN